VGRYDVVACYDFSMICGFVYLQLVVVYQIDGKHAVFLKLCVSKRLILMIGLANETVLFMKYKCSVGML